MTRGSPRAQYERTYVLVHKSMGTAEVKRVIAASWNTHRYTVGQSADDAGIGDLDCRRVIVIEAWRWGGEAILRNWFGDWYPECELVFIDSVSDFEKLMESEPPVEPLPTRKLAIGFHDRTGGEYAAGKSLPGVCLVHEIVQKEARVIDCNSLRAAGQTVIVRLNWGYADGTGTLPRSEDKDAFVNAVVQTILASEGVDFWHIGNEPNNRSEWPGFRADLEARGIRLYEGLFPLTIEYVIGLYNTIYLKVNGRAKLGPPPIDPYFGPGSNNRDWWRALMGGIIGAQAIFLHGGKTQTNAVAEIKSHDKFTDDPLKWQFVGSRSIETGIADVPSRFSTLPVYCTEINPQRRSDGALGWDDDNVEWVIEAVDYFTSQSRVTGIVIYRWEATGSPKDKESQWHFGLEHKPKIVEQIVKEIRR